MNTGSMSEALIALSGAFSVGLATGFLLARTAYKTSAMPSPAPTPLRATSAKNVEARVGTVRFFTHRATNTRVFARVTGRLERRGCIIVKYKIWSEDQEEPMGVDAFESENDEASFLRVYDTVTLP